MKMTREQLLATLDDIRDSVARGDTFEGQLAYSCMEPGLEVGSFEVSGAYRVGNLDGQGGVNIINAVNHCPEIPTADGLEAPEGDGGVNYLAGPR